MTMLSRPPDDPRHLISSGGGGRGQDYDGLTFPVSIESVNPGACAWLDLYVAVAL
ncbi:MAG: hypothetical protein JW384_03812 [Nitrosomonadaceae bacterium]|nr:hypothetical protein [Nitrosomonadaceae bacterium]